MKGSDIGLTDDQSEVGSSTGGNDNAKNAYCGDRSYHARRIDNCCTNGR